MWTVFKKFGRPLAQRLAVLALLLSVVPDVLAAGNDHHFGELQSGVAVDATQSILGSGTNSDPHDDSIPRECHHALCYFFVPPSNFLISTVPNIRTLAGRIDDAYILTSQAPPLRPPRPSI